MNRTISRVASALVLAGASCALAQEVKYEKYTLPNGLTVILHEDHSLPVVGINTWFRVGAKDEPAGRSGFAHLFEHLMFMGTQRVPGNQFDIIMETGGGSNNASTSFDRTNYFSNGPASLLPTLLWLDADRLEDLGRTMTQEKLDRQRDVVRNERRQTTENEPYGKAELEITAIMFPEGHPYHNEVIGTHADLEAASVQNVKDFFANFYIPNNASLVIAGDFDPAKVKPLVNDLYASIKRGFDPVRKVVAPVHLDREIRAVTLDQVQAPRVEFAYHSPPTFAPGDAELDLLGAVLSQGKSSRLYKRLVMDDKLATDVSAYQNSALLQSVFRIDVTAVPGADLDQVEKIVDEETDRLINDGVRPEELEQRKATIELMKVSTLQSVAAKADKLNEYEFFFGEPDSFKRDLDRYRNATPSDVREWARKTLTRNARLVMRVLPDQPDRDASARDHRPTDFQPGEFAPPSPQTFTLAGGVPVQLWSRHDLPIVTIRVLATPGGPLDTPQSAGLSELASTMMGEGAGGMSAEKFADAVQSLGATFAAGADQESAAVDLTVVRRNFEKAAELVRRAIREPNMSGDDWERVKRLHLEDLRQDDDEPTTVASRVGRRILFGDRSPFGWPTKGTKATVGSMTLDQVKARQKELFSPAHCTILVAGDLTRSDAEQALNKLFGDWTGGAPRAQGLGVSAAEPNKPGLRVAIVDRPGAVQTVVRFFTPGVRYDNPDRASLRLLNTILGGSFTSRLNQNLREAHGYTYGARSTFAMEPSGGYFMASASVKSDVTGASLTEFFNEFKRLDSGDISDEETTKASETVRTDAIERFQGVHGVISSAADPAEAGLPFSTVGADMNAIAKITTGQLNDLARRAVNLNAGVLVLVGDRALILDQIKDLHLAEPVEYDADGAPKGR